MQQSELKTLVEEIAKQKTERQDIELKEAHGGFPGKIYDTLSSFSNQDSGGTIIFGMKDKPDYTVTGVYNAEDVQKKIMEQCGQMEPTVRAVITVCEIDGKMVAAAEIPGAELHQRPVFYKGRGRLGGSYVRVGDADEPMTEYEIYSYEAFRRRIRDDLRTVKNARFQLFDKERLNRYLETVKFERENLSRNVPDEDILEMMGVTADGEPTLAGLLTFSRYPQTYFPQLCITAVAVPGTEIGETGDEGERFIDNKRITGAIPEMVEQAVDFVQRNSRIRTIIDENGRRADKPEYPIKAVREAVLNALIHRDLSVYTEGIPVEIRMYRDRMEIISSGGLFGLLSVDTLGKVRPEARNAALANMLEILHVTENRYSGIPTIRKELRDAKLPEAEFYVRHGEFKVIFRNDLAEQRRPLVREEAPTGRATGKKNAMRNAILEFCRVPRTREELYRFTKLSRYRVISGYIQPLVREGKLKLTIPEKPRSTEQRYVAGIDPASKKI